MHNLALVLALCAGGFAPALAQNSVSTEAPLPRPKKPVTAPHKQKPAAPTKQTDIFSELDKTPPSKTIPMDFSGMAKRPVDLPSENSGGSKSESDGLKPAVGSNGNGSFSPGANFNF